VWISSVNLNVETMNEVLIVLQFFYHFPFFMAMYTFIKQYIDRL